MSTEKAIKVGIVGIGARGIGILRMLLRMEDVEVLAVCEKREDHLEEARQTVAERKKQSSPTLFTKDYHDLLKMDEIQAICEKHSVPLIEDAAEALGSEYHGRKCGNFGRFGILSFNGEEQETTLIYPKRSETLESDSISNVCI